MFHAYGLSKHAISTTVECFWSKIALVCLWYDETHMYKLAYEMHHSGQSVGVAQQEVWNHPNIVFIFREMKMNWMKNTICIYIILDSLF